MTPPATVIHRRLRAPILVREGDAEGPRKARGEQIIAVPELDLGGFLLPAGPSAADVANRGRYRLARVVCDLNRCLAGEKGTDADP